MQCIVQPHLGCRSYKCLFFFLRGNEWYFTDWVNLGLAHKLGLNGTYKLLDQVILGLLLQLQQFTPCLWQRYRAVAQEVQYCAEMFAASVNKNPPWTTNNATTLSNSHVKSIVYNNNHRKIIFCIGAELPFCFVA